ncbi:MAG: hypothetical protein M3033_10300 [Acidobacteriota bacterium]|nr:hypothetical protein [Acidobacteriota bacterium]
MKKQILISLFLLTIFFVGNIFSQIAFTSDKVIFKKLNFGFCSQGEQDDFPRLNHHSELLLEIFKSISSKEGSFEVDGRAKQIIFSDTQIKIKNFKDIVSLIDESITESSSRNKCTRETKVTLFLHQID